METLTLLRLLAVYIALTALERATDSGAVRALVNAFGVAMLLAMIAYFALRRQRIEVPAGLGIAYAVYAGALLVSVVVAGLYNVGDLVKFLLAPIFAVLGYSAEPPDLEDRRVVAQLRLVGLVLLLPVLYALVRQWSGAPGDELGIFANRNNAALYLVVLSNLLFLTGAGIGVVIASLAVGVILFSTLGVIIAVLGALLVSLSFKRYIGAYLLAAVVGGFLLFGPLPLPVGERVDRLLEAVSAITALGLWTELAHLSYGDLYLVTGRNTDLSLFFRLKHWEDLLLVWSTHGWVGVWFGLGIGSSPLHTEIGLVPHNDYVRFLVEAGPLAFAGFVAMTAWLLWSIGRRVVLLSTGAVAIYFFTENLVDNFAAMTLYYWFAGYWARARQTDTAGDPTIADRSEGPHAGRGPGEDDLSAGSAVRP